MQAVAEVEKVGVVCVDEVEQLLAQQLRARAQFGAQVLERLVAVAQGGQVGGGGEVGGEEVGALQRRGVGQRVQAIVVVRGRGGGARRRGLRARELGGEQSASGGRQGGGVQQKEGQRDGGTEGQRDSSCSRRIGSWRQRRGHVFVGVGVDVAVAVSCPVSCRRNSVIDTCRRAQCAPVVTASPFHY
jgi:hypothetical protein